MPKPHPKSPPPQQNPAVALAVKTLSSLPALSDAARAAFAGQTTTEECAQLGGRTKSANVLREAGGWLAVINRGLAKHGEVIRYGTARLAFFCEAMLALDAAMVEARGARTGAVASGARREAAMGSGRAVRDDLRHALGQVTRGTADAATLADIERDLLHDDQLAVALGKLGEILSAKLARAEEDPQTRALLDGARLSRADLERVEAAREAIVAAGSDRVEAGSRSRNDPRDVNIAEGMLLAEMRVAKKAFDAARTTLAAVPRLVPGPATRAVLGGRSGTHARRSTGASDVAPPGTTGA